MGARGKAASCAVIPASMAPCPELMAEGYLQIKRAIYVRGQDLNRFVVHFEIVCVIVSGSAALRYVSAFKSTAYGCYPYGERSMEPSLLSAGF